MSSIIATAVASARHEFAQPEVKERAQAWLAAAAGRATGGARALKAFDSALVARRTAAIPLEEVFRVRGFAASNDRYIEEAIALATQVAADALKQAGVAPEEVDLVVSTSCTGYMIPSVDAYVAERLGMKPALRRLPFTEHGCAGGAVALGAAHDHLLAHPRRIALVIAVELPSLTFQVGDRSPANVVSAALFGDGAAAAVLAGRAVKGAPRIVRTASHRFPRSLDWMGFHLKESGLHIVLSSQIPRRVREAARDLVTGFLAGSGLKLPQVRHLLFHPGGRKILEAFEQTLELPEGALDLSRKVLRERGNLSSATVLWILHELLTEKRARRGDHGILLAFGPGFGAEFLLLRWS